MQPKYYETAYLHLDVLGQRRKLSLQVRTGEATLDDLLAVAKEISRQTSSIVAEITRASEQNTISCVAGCTACCYHLIPISPLEARSLARCVTRLPQRQQQVVRRQFNTNIHRLEELGLLGRNDAPGRWFLRSSASDGDSRWQNASLQYFNARLRCPFLTDNDWCAIYDERPCACSEYAVTTPAELCATLSPEVKSIPRPVRMDEVLAATVGELIGRDLLAIPLTLALEWMDTHGHLLDGHFDGEAMFWALIKQCQAATAGS